MWSFLFLMFLLQLASQAQNKKYFIITGRIAPEAGLTESSVIEITKNGKESSTIDISKNGRFRLELEFFSEYSLTFKYPGHFNKIILISTDMPQDVWQANSEFPPFPMVVQLLKEFEGIDKSFTLKPSGRVFYGKDIDNFEKESYVSDIQFLEQIQTAKSQANKVQKEAQSITKENAQDLAAKQKNFDQLIKDADALYQRGEYQMALMKYLEAKNLFPDKAYPNDRVAELQDLVKALQITEKQKTELEQKYKDAIAKANGFFEQKSYQNARPIYEEALQYKPGDVFSNGRINEIDQLLALLEKQKQYKDLVAQADNNYKSKNYDKAIELYNQAKQVVPDEKYPQVQIDQITQEKQQQANLQLIEKEFSKTIQTADGLTQKKDYFNALNSYKKALELKPDSKLAQDKISETEQAMVAVETDKKYLQAIQLADQAMASNDMQKAKIQYQEALKYKNGESYPKDKLGEIAASEAEEITFNGLLAKAEKAFTDNNLDESLNSFTQALELKPKNKAIQKRIDDIQNLKKLQLTDKEYAGLISQADQSFTNNQLDASLTSYNKALQIKSSESYPKEQIRRIGNYQSLIKKADKSFDSKDYSAALGIYNEALVQKPSDTYALGKIAGIAKIQEDMKLLEEKAKNELTAYNDAIKNADQLFTAQNYSESLNKYKEASSIKDSEAYPRKRIKEIENIQDGLAKEKTRKDKEYQVLIAEADKLLDKKDYHNAQAEYQKALDIKPDDTYPKAQIQKINDTLAANLKLEEDNKRLQNAKQDEEFNRAMATGDKAFAANDLNAAKTAYQAALSIKPNDPIAKQKFGQTDAKIAQMARMNQAYNTAIKEANLQLTGKHYKEAKEKYQESLQYLPDSEYPLSQIAKINEVLAQQETEAKTLADFNQAVIDGEALLKNKELAKAKDAFMKAYNLIPSETVPPKRISEINTLLADQARKDTELKATLEAYQAAIQKADKYFGNKEYTSAQLAYNEALLIKSDEKYPEDQLALIDKLLKEQNEQNYKTAIAKADNAFNTSQLDDASKAYQEALRFKKNDPYAMKRLKDIDQKKADSEAEKIRLKKLDDQYTALMADANTDFKNKVYISSKGKYLKALNLKPAEVFPKEQIAKIDQILGDIQKDEETNRQYAELIKAGQESFKINKLKEARDSYQKAYDLKPNEPVPPIRIAQIDAMLAQLSETAQLAAQEEAQRLAKEKADRDQYNNAIAAGDKSFAEKQYKIARSHYTTALTALPNEKYPRDQIAKIDNMIAQDETAKMLANQKAQQDSMLKAKEKVFTQTMTEAKDNEQNKRYEQAIQKYKDAIQIKPDQRASIQNLIRDDEEKLKLLAKQETEYKRIIKLADDLYTQSKLEEAHSQYGNAATIKTDEDYPKQQIKEIQSVLTARDQSYTNAITLADKAFDTSDWANAKTGYTEALGIKPNEAYPLKRLKEVNQKIADTNLAAASDAANAKAFEEAMVMAEKSMKEDQLSTARMQFKVAQSLKPDEKLPAERIKEIDLLIDQRNKDRLANTQREIDEKYRQAISVADISFREKSYSIAKLQYKQALIIKPDESYPKSQMVLCDKLLNEAKPVETYAFKLPEVKSETLVSKLINNPIESAQATETRAQSFKPIADYDEAVKKADESFGIKDYSVARFFYTKANEIKPNEEYPKNQLELIRKLIDSQMSRNDISGYDQAIAQADKAFADKNYTIAKFFYYKALDIKSWEKYPKDRINEILALTNSLLSEKEEKEYRDIIAKADEAYFNKDISIARFYYNKALSMKKDEKYPGIKLKDIQKLIEQDQQDKRNQDYLKLIADGDQALKLENYSIARFNYNKALVMKPDEKYPKDQLKQIREALDKPMK